MLGAPVVHLAYRRPRRALEDAGTRVVLPVAGAVAGFATGAAVGAIHACAVQEASPMATVTLGTYAGIFGAAAGGALAIGLDAARAKQPAETLTRAPTLLTTIRPDLVVDRRLAGFGVRGTF
jgi:hypothetical protein